MQFDSAGDVLAVGAAMFYFDVNFGGFVQRLLQQLGGLLPILCGYEFPRCCETVRPFYVGGERNRYKRLRRWFLFLGEGESVNKHENQGGPTNRRHGMLLCEQESMEQGVSAMSK